MKRGGPVSMHSFRIAFMVVFLAGVATTGAHAERGPHYMGREIATTMSFHGADWLTRANREKEEKSTELHAALHITRGSTVCDVGAGNGFHTLPLAHAVGACGEVVAVDIQREMLTMITERARKDGLKNIRTILGKPDDSALPAQTCDLILLVDVYHEFADPEAMLRSLRHALAPAGRIALVEFRAEDTNVPIKPLHKMSLKQILREYEANGFVLADRYQKLPWQHLLFFISDAPASQLDEDPAPIKVPADPDPDR